MTAPTPPQTTTPALEFIDADIRSASNPDISILEKVNWKVRPGEFWCVGGLHRSGKSDLLQVASGLVNPTRGKRLLFGEEQLPRDHPSRLKVGMVFDGGQVFQDLSIEENLTLPVRYHQNLSPDEAIGRIEPILDLIGLTPLRHEPPGRLGRNWQQRVGLARALTLKPTLLLLDNPLSGLDPHDAAWWTNFLTELSTGHPLMENKGMTLITTSDSLQLWKGTARQFAVLKAKKFHRMAGPPGHGARNEELITDFNI